MPDERAVMDQVSRYWNAYVLGHEAGIDVDPGLASAIQRIHELGAIPPSSTRDRVWEAVIAGHDTGSQREDGPMLRMLAPSQRPFLLPGADANGKGIGGQRRRWPLAQFATAALLAITLIGSFFAFGPGRAGRPRETSVFIPAIVATPATPQAEEAPSVAELLWETKGGPNRPLGLPGPLALDPAGNLWVTDSTNDRFQIFSPDGTFLEAWGRTGDGEGQFEFERTLFPGGAIAFAPDGGFYVVDTGNLRIQRFAPNRTFVTTWGGEGIGEGQFKWPSSVAVDDQGHVYVTDDQRNDVQVFDANGAFLNTIGEYGFGDGQFFFSSGSSVSIDAAGKIWVSDGSNHRIQTFTPDGALLSVMRGGAGKDQLSKPAQIGIDREGRIFVAAPDLREVQVFAPDGSFIASWGDPGAAAWSKTDLPGGMFLTPSGLVLDGLGNIYVSDTEGERVQKFRLLRPLAPPSSAAATLPPAANAPVAEFLWRSEGSPDQPFSEPNHPVIDLEGNIWVPDGWNSRFVIYAPDGTVRETWGAEGSGDGEFLFESTAIGFGGVAFDAAGNIYVADAGNHRIQKFGPDRTFIAAWGSDGLGDGQLYQPVALVVDSGRERLYVSDRWGEIEVFDTDGRWLERWEGLSAPVGITLDASGNVWVADESKTQVIQFSPEGEQLTVWNEYGGADGQLAQPAGVDVDAEGRVFVSDRNNRVQIFSPDGEFLGSWGSPGNEEGEIFGPYGIAVDDAGTAYVAQDFGRRLDAFRLLPPFAPQAAARPTAPLALAETADDGAVAEVMWQSEGGPALPLDDPGRLAIGPDGNLWVADGQNSRFQIFTPDGRFLEAWGTPGENEGQLDFVEPTLFGGFGSGSLAFDASGNLFVGDPGNYRVQKFGPDRSFVASWGRHGRGEGQFAAIIDVAVDDQGRVYVADETRGDIQVFDNDGGFLAVWSDTAEDWPGSPSSITIDAEGNIWTGHFRLHTIRKYTQDGGLLAGWGELGIEPGQFINPSDLSIDAEGRIFVAEWANNRIQVFDGAGRFLTTWGSSGPDEGQFMGLNGSVLDRDGNLVVSEDGSDRIQKFRLLPPLAPG